MWLKAGVARVNSASGVQSLTYQVSKRFRDDEPHPATELNPDFDTGCEILGL